ncbi:MAG: methylenetetrahydrofolate reductase [NAD(P)H] [Deltaproteobacteria bacterium]|nr:methylenetetrahydrofolate reductase [NAD(P)H] [Deltaproteobacteria bacterium]
MKIIDKLALARPAFSLEFFPPKDQAGVDQLFETVRALAPYSPTYVSVTWGAGGSTRGLTIDLVRRIKREAGIEAMAHLTCVGATREEIDGILDQLVEAGIENVLALRGDPPRGESRFVKTEGGFGSGAELVAAVRARPGLSVAAACYPETHPEAESPEADLRHLAAKARAGADFLVSQLFFDNEDYFRFVDRARGAGISCPIIAGIWPITNVAQIRRITGLCGARIPPALQAKLDEVKDDPEKVRAVGVEHATAQCRELVRRGVPGIHFYTLNRSRATVDILEALRADGPT